MFSKEIHPSLTDLPENMKPQQNAAASTLQQWFRSRNRRDNSISTITVCNIENLYCGITIMNEHYYQNNLILYQEQLHHDLVLFWTLLHEGISVVKYSSTGSKKSPKILWLEQNGERIIIGKAIQHQYSRRLQFRSFGKKKAFHDKTKATPHRGLKKLKGIYLRDIAEIRYSTKTYAFALSPLQLPEAQVF